MKKYIVPSVIAIASVMAICLCLFCRGRKSQGKAGERRMKTKKKIFRT